MHHIFHAQHITTYNFGRQNDFKYILLLVDRTRVPGFSNCSLESLKRLNDWCLYNVPTYKVSLKYKTLGKN